MTLNTQKVKDQAAQPVASSVNLLLSVYLRILISRTRVGDEIHVDVLRMYVVLCISDLSWSSQTN